MSIKKVFIDLPVKFKLESHEASAKGYGYVANYEAVNPDLKTVDLLSKVEGNILKQNDTTACSLKVSRCPSGDEPIFKQSDCLRSLLEISKESGITSDCGIRVTVYSNTDSFPEIVNKMRMFIVGMYERIYFEICPTVELKKKRKFDHIEELLEEE